MPQDRTSLPDQRCGLPPLATISLPRGTSAPLDYVTLGRQELVRSEYSEESADSMVMEPAGAGYAWTVYELSTAGQPTLNLTVELEVANGEVWFGLSDFDRNAWHFLPPVATTDAHELSLAAANAADNNVYLAVISTPGSLVTISRLIITVDQPGWLIYTLDDQNHAGENLQMFVQDFKPMLAYGSSNLGAIRFLRATTSFPTQPGEWVSMTVDSAPGPARLGAPLAAASVNGRPAIAYVETEEDIVMYAYSTVAEPAGTTDWNTMEVFDAISTGQQLGLADIGGRPGISFDYYYDELYFAQAPDSTPVSGDWTSSPVVGGTDEASSSSLDYAGNRPLIFCQGVLAEGAGGCYFQAKVAQPAGPADWNHYVAFGFGPGGAHNSLDTVPLKPSGYRPIASFLNDNWGGSLVVNVGRLQLPTEPADWRINYVDHNVFSNAICSSNGYPFVVYVNTVEQSVKCAWAQEHVPVNSDDWSYSVLESGISAGSVDAVSISNTPIIAYRDGTNNVLKFGFYDG